MTVCGNGAGIAGSANANGGGNGVGAGSDQQAALAVPGRSLAFTGASVNLLAVWGSAWRSSGWRSA